MFASLLTGGIPWKLVGAGVIGLVIWLGYNMITGYIDDLKTENRNLIEQVNTLETQVDSLESDVRAKEQAINDITREFQALQESERASQNRIAEFESERISEERKARIDAIQNGGRASLLLRLTNSAAKCEWEHFADYTGECRGGRWVPYETDNEGNDNE